MQEVAGHSSYYSFTCVRRLLVSMACSVRYGGACSPTKGTSKGRAGAEGATNMNCVYSLGVCTEEGETHADGSGFPMFDTLLFFLASANYDCVTGILSS